MIWGGQRNVYLKHPKIPWFGTRKNKPKETTPVGVSDQRRPAEVTLLVTMGLKAWPLLCQSVQVPS